MIAEKQKFDELLAREFNLAFDFDELGETAEKIHFLLAEKEKFIQAVAGEKFIEKN